MIYVDSNKGVITVDGDVWEVVNEFGNAINAMIDNAAQRGEGVYQEVSLELLHVATLVMSNIEKEYGFKPLLGPLEDLLEENFSHTDDNDVADDSKDTDADPNHLGSNVIQFRDYLK